MDTSLELLSLCLDLPGEEDKIEVCQNQLE